MEAAAGERRAREADGARQGAAEERSCRRVRAARDRAGELAIDTPPALPDVSAIRELLLREPIVWKRVGGIGGDEETQARRTVQMTAARALAASALAKARANDPAAWEDLHAAWKLARSMDGHPQVMAQTAGLAMARMINAAAWKLPLPASAM